MHQANQSGWYVNADGREVFVQKGVVRPDNHPDVAALPVIFDPLDVDEPAPRPARTKKS